MSERSRRTAVVGIVFVLITSACATPAAPPPTPGPLDIAQAFEAGFNQRAVETTAALFVDNPV